ncbi:MAG: DNA polymerase I [Bacteroidales bacterium]|nr:DNA polymerase I [Bacteroidales bacterium]
MKLFLIDGHALIFKMYYAFLGRPMINAKGVDTSILFGFTKYLLELIRREQPTPIAVGFDPPGGTFRNQLYPEYKANRGETPQLVIDALEPLTQIVKALNIPVLMIPGFEADDVLGSMAKRSAREGFDVYMVTPDKDYGQLLEPHIFQVKPGKKGGDDELYDIPRLQEKYGIERPDQIIDMLAICGDASDNVPGVKGVGEVGASKLLQKYDTLEKIYSHLDELTPRQQELFRAAEDHIALSKVLVTIKTDIDIPVSADDMLLEAARPEAMELFNLYGFNSLKKYLNIPDSFDSLGMTGAGSLRSSERTAEGGTELRSSDVGSPGAAGDLGAAPPQIGSPQDELPQGEDLPQPTDTKPSDIAIYLDGETLWLADEDGTRSGRLEEFKKDLEDAGKSKAGYGIKAQMNELAKRGISLKGKLLDIELMHYLLNPESDHRLTSLAQTYLGISLDEAPAADLGSLFGDDGGAPGEADHTKEAEAIRSLSGTLYGELAASGMQKLYDEIEEPLISVLSQMELVGVKVDLSSLKDFAESLRKQMLAREEEIRGYAENPALNVSSPKQMGEVIFEKLNLDPKAKKPSKGTWPTDEETLSALADRHPIIDALLDYRGLRKLLSTYIEPFAQYISPVDGRVHTTFNQALTATGRLSSSNPNLQNIPIRTEQGREIRKAFVPGEPGKVMMSADYSQIELRVMAHLCGDEHMRQAFREGQDVHAATAAKIFRKPVADVTADDRRMAKTANFGIMYGISSFGLAQRLKCPRTVAKKLIDDYFESFPSIRSFIDGTLAKARETLYTETMFGRRRYISDINSHNANIRAIAERNAVNAPIQGTAADIIKLAMIRVAARLRKEGLKAVMVLQIHDELLLEVPENEIDAVKALLVEEMQGVMELSVPLTVECNYGKTWLEAH